MHKKIKEIISTVRVEKVVRISLIALKALLKNKEVCEEVVIAGVYDAVSNLEFEKWRDAELYDEIRDMGLQIANYVHELSSFDRYERELQSGQLRWGFLHTSKFWGENVAKLLFGYENFNLWVCCFVPPQTIFYRIYIFKSIFTFYIIHKIHTLHDYLLFYDSFNCFNK